MSAATPIWHTPFEVADLVAERVLDNGIAIGLLSEDEQPSEGEAFTLNFADTGQTFEVCVVEVGP